MPLSTLGFYLLLLAGGALFAAAAGMVSSWIDRKVTARVQARVGPPLAQPLYDFVKLLGKETLIPEGANRLAFTMMPLLALAAVSLAAAILLGNLLWQNGLLPSAGGLSGYGMVGDLIVVLYLLAVPSLALVLGASASNNPFASVGASREMKLMSYELPLLLAVIAALVLAAASDRRFTREVQRQADAALVSPRAADSPLASPMKGLRNAQDRLIDLYAEARPQKGAELRKLWNDFKIVHESGVAGAKVEAARKPLDETMKAIEAGLSAEAAAKIAGQKAACNEFGRKTASGGPVAAVTPLRFDALLVLRDAGPAPQAELLARQGRDRVSNSPEIRGLQAQIREKRLEIGKVDKDLVKIEGLAAPAGFDAEKLAADLEDLKYARATALAEYAKLERELSRCGDDAKIVNAKLDGARLAAAVQPAPLARWAALAVLALGVAVAFFCAQAKLGLVPFDCAEAETEIAGGVLIEYGGPLLAVWKLSRHMLLFLLPVFIGIVFMGGFRFFVPDGDFWAHLGQIGVSLAKYVGILVVIVLVRNTNPRVRIDQAMRFFLGPMTTLAVLALVLAVFVYQGWLG